MSRSVEDMLDELCHLAILRNEIQQRRQRARSREGYFLRIMRAKEYVKSGFQVDYWTDQIPKKYRNCTKGELKAKVKKNLAMKLLAEAELHEFTLKNTKRVRKLLKAAGYRQFAGLGTNRIHGFYPKEAHVAGGCDCHQPIREQDMRTRSDDFVTEAILLRGDYREPSSAE